MKKQYYDNELAKTDFYTLNRKQNISARRKTGNNKNILMTNRIFLQIARKLLSIEIPITEKPLNRLAS